MNKKVEWQKQVARLGREVGEWLAEMSEENLDELEERLEPLVKRLQKEYGWTAARARKELAAYLDEYGSRTQAIVDRTLDQLNARFHSRHKRKQRRGGRWLWAAFALGVFVVAWQLIRPGESQV